MGKERLGFVGIICAVLAVLICVAGIFHSISLKKTVLTYHDELDELRQSEADLVEKLNILIQTNPELKKKQLLLAEKQALFQNELSAINYGSFSSKELSAISEEGENLASDNQKKIQQLARIINSTGLEEIAVDENLDPGILSKIYKDYALKNRVKDYREKMRAENREMHRLDQDQYNDELSDLYTRARLRMMGEQNAEDREKAFDEMLKEFPTAYKTGMAIAERALRSALMRESSDAEKYYAMLRENEKFTHIVTDRGTEAMPNVEYFLADYYIRQGNMLKGREMVESLEGKYVDSLIYKRRPGGRLKLLPASQVISELRMLME
jgi:hypothetical protein